MKYSIEMFNTAADDKWEWKVKNRDDVTIARSPKRYKTQEAARAAVDKFMEALPNVREEQQEKSRIF